MTLKVSRTVPEGPYPFTIGSAPEGVYIDKDGVVWIVTIAEGLIEVTSGRALVWECGKAFGHLQVAKYSGAVTFSNSDE